MNCKIFQIGFNKCGTTSLHHLFLESGINSIHYDEGKLARQIYLNYNAGNALLHGYKSYSAFTDMQNTKLNIYAHKYYKTFYQQYKGSYFILNTRPKENWIKSRCNHGKGALLKHFEVQFGFSAQQTIAYWSKEWDSFHKKTQEFFSNKTRFLKFDIENDPIEKIG